MGFEFDDLPHWEFTIVEMSPGVYRVTAVRDGGIRAESTGEGPDEMMEDLKAWARKTERDLAAKQTE
jgi:hypothetical protein